MKAIPSSLSDQMATTHVDEEWGQFFLWHPENQARELLFELPLEDRGHQWVGADGIAKYRRGQRYVDSIHRIRFMDAAIAQGRLEGVIQTYVVRPDTVTRRFTLENRDLEPVAQGRTVAAILGAYSGS